MQVIAVAGPGTRASRAAIARSAVIATLMLVIGAILAWACLTTPLISAFMPSGRPSMTQMAAGVIAWGFAIVVPAGFLILGAARVVATVEGIAALRPRRVTRHLARALGPDHLAAAGLVLPGGRRIHELVLGPFGIVVLGDVPPPSVSRHVGTRWEIRGERGRWMPIEGPLDRVSRDAERVRGWLATDDRDFLVQIVRRDRHGRRPGGADARLRGGRRRATSPPGSRPCRCSAASPRSAGSGWRR